MSLQGNDAFLVGPQRAVTEASTKSIMIFPAPMHLPASPISPYPIWRPQQTKPDAEENVENLDESLSRPPKAISLTIKRNEEQEPKALALQQSQPNQRTYRSDNSAREYKIIRYSSKLLIVYYWYNQHPPLTNLISIYILMQAIEK